MYNIDLCSDHQLHEAKVFGKEEIETNTGLKWVTGQDPIFFNLLVKQIHLNHLLRQSSKHMLQRKFNPIKAGLFFAFYVRGGGSIRPNTLAANNF